MKFILFFTFTLCTILIAGQLQLKLIAAFDLFLRKNLNFIFTTVKCMTRLTNSSWTALVVG